MMKTTKKGFTLAEVLTTLMVIGVVAAMTIPTLMNSTNDQQLKVAYKKAMSVLGQGVQLMVAKEVQCRVQSSADLAACFANNVLSGSRVNYENDSAAGANDELNVVTTSDGMAYQFFYLDADGRANNTERTLDEICGDSSLWSDSTQTAAQMYAGNNAKCAVIVDVNGFSKGTKEFANNGQNQNINQVLNGIAAAGEGANAVAARGHGTDQLPIYLTGTGVRPIYDNTKAVNTGINKGYEYMYGKGAQPVENAAQGGGNG